MKMEQAYDPKALVAFIKDQGLEVAEESVKAIYMGTKAWLKESAVLSATPVDNLVAPFYDQLDPIVLPLIDKINPADNAVV